MLRPTRNKYLANARAPGSHRSSPHVWEMLILWWSDELGTQPVPQMPRGCGEGAAQEDRLWLLLEQLELCLLHQTVMCLLWKHEIQLEIQTSFKTAKHPPFSVRHVMH